MSTTFIEAVAVGVVPLPHKRLEEAVFTYTDGTIITLTGDASRAWFQDYVAMWLTITQMSQAPVFSADAVRERLSKQSGTIKSSNGNNGDDT
jgi:hypothetical protein